MAEKEEKIDKELREIDYVNQKQHKERKEKNKSLGYLYANLINEVCSPLRYCLAELFSTKECEEKLQNKVKLKEISSLSEITGIISHSELALEYLKKVDAFVKRLHVISANKKEDRIEAIVIAAICSDIVKAIKQKNHSFSSPEIKAISGEEIEFACQKEFLSMALIALVDNSMKSSSAIGLECYIRVERKDRNIIISYSDNEDRSWKCNYNQLNDSPVQTDNSKYDFGEDLLIVDYICHVHLHADLQVFLTDSGKVVIKIILYDAALLESAHVS